MARLLHPRKAWGYPTLPSGTRVGRVIVHRQPPVHDPWTAYWDDGQQVAGCTFTDSGVPCANLGDGPQGTHDMHHRPVPWGEVPTEVRRAIIGQAKAWDVSGDLRVVAA